MNHAELILTQLNAIIWLPVIAALLAMAVYLNVRLKCLPWRRIGTAVVMLWRGRSTAKKEHLSPLQSLMIALSATIGGGGGIVGIAIAITLGGPGAVFWLWTTALLGMVTQYAEAVLAVEYREQDEYGYYIGGPMCYIKNGLERKWLWLASFFALCGALAALGIGNMMQANAIATAVAVSFKIPAWKSAIIIACVTAVVVLTGVKRFVNFGVYLVSSIILVYLSAGLWVIFHHLPQLPGALLLIIKSAFTPTAAAAGFTGATVWIAVRSGLEQGIFCNDAGFGRGSIAHATADIPFAVQQGYIAMLGTLINVFLIGTVTALVIIVTGAWNSGKTGLDLSVLAFSGDFHHWSLWFVTLSVSLFAFMSLLGWSFYGERCATFLLGSRAVWPYRLLWLCIIPVGATHKITLIWLLASIFNALMAIPNLIALALLAPVLFRITRNYLRLEN